ncbi:myb/SANT-like DNA-binding domain-containing protein isoform X2 [Xyrauchen texanus]|uniref:myb/SANT-like DNA-binding domain-containing protein isoform X2 n=1 Tax=Xyrauchen texanus TaxID=154827 RepID=UPI002242058A|nr:myb/SANT-like DNA-binding domain-containing protein isoform X2 [Xyrauchen texanus]
MEVIKEESEDISCAEACRVKIEDTVEQGATGLPKTDQQRMENRQYWSVDEISALLNIWADENVQRQIDGVCRNEEVIKYIVAELSKLCIKRTTVQVREKLKKLRAQYKSVKTHNGQSGAQRKNFPWFKIMDGVLGHRHAVSEETTHDTIAVTVDDSSSPSASLESEEGDEGPCTAPLRTSTLTHIPTVIKIAENSDQMSFQSTLERPATPQCLIRGGSHLITQRTRPENRKRRASSLATSEFLQCMREMTQQQMKQERELRREEMNREMEMRQKEMEHEARLRREEMARREKETETFASVFKNLASALLPRT